MRMCATIVPAAARPPARCCTARCRAPKSTAGRCTATPPASAQHMSQSGGRAPPAVATEPAGAAGRRGAAVGAEA
eukprot:363963-Chlamydomonas_euryale.AAC.5